MSILCGNRTHNVQVQHQSERQTLSASVKLQRSDRYLQEPQQLHISRQEHFNFTKRYLHSSSGYNRLTRNISLYPYANPAYIPVPNSRDLAHSICTKTCSYNGHTDSLCTVKRDVELELGLSVKTLKAFVELALFYYGLKEIRPLRFATSNRCSIKLKRIFFGRYNGQMEHGFYYKLQCYKSTNIEIFTYEYLVDSGSRHSSIVYC